MGLSKAIVWYNLSLLYMYLLEEFFLMCTPVIEKIGWWSKMMMKCVLVIWLLQLFQQCDLCRCLQQLIRSHKWLEVVLQGQSLHHLSHYCWMCSLLPDPNHHHWHSAHTPPHCYFHPSSVFYTLQFPSPASVTSYTLSLSHAVLLFVSCIHSYILVTLSASPSVWLYIQGKRCLTCNWKCYWGYCLR